MIKMGINIILMINMLYNCQSILYGDSCNLRKLSVDVLENQINGKEYSVTLYCCEKFNYIKVDVVIDGVRIRNFFNREYGLDPNHVKPQFVMTSPSGYDIIVFNEGAISLQQWEIDIDSIYNEIDKLSNGKYCQYSPPTGILAKTCLVRIGHEKYLIHDSGLIVPCTIENLPKIYKKEGMAFTSESYQKLALDILEWDKSNSKSHIVREVSEIQGYYNNPLDDDFSNVVRAPWLITSKGRDYFIFYTYKREKGVLCRYKLFLDTGILTDIEKIILGTGIGDATDLDLRWRKLREAG